MQSKLDYPPTAAINSSTNKVFIFVSVFLFLVVQTWIFFYRSNVTDYHAYERYGQAYRDGSVRGMYANNSIEYPPLAALLFAFTSTLAEQLPELHVWNSQILHATSQSDLQFKIVFRSLMTCVTLAIFCALLSYLTSRSRSERGVMFERVLAFLLGLACLGDLSLDRLDIVLAALIMLSMLLLFSRLHFLWSFLVLAIGIDYKIVPLVLVPLWILGSLPVSVLRKGWLEIAAAIVWRGIFMVAAIVVFILPIYLAAGSRCLDFFIINRDRGLECESSYAALTGILKHTIGLDVQYGLKFGSFNTESSLSPVFLTLAPLMLGSVVLTANFILFAMGRSRAKVASIPEDASRRLCNFCHADFLTNTIFVCMTFILFNKVFSPQYVLWLIPIAPLVTLKGWKRRIFLLAFVGLCATTYLVGHRWFDQIMGQQLGGLATTGPTALGECVLTLRTLLLLGLVLALGANMVRSLRNREVPLSH